MTVSSSRRAVLAGLLGSAAVPLAASAQIIPRAKLVLTVASAFPRGFSLFFPALERLNANLEGLSEGKLGLSLSDGIPPRELFGAVVDRKLDGYCGFESYWSAVDSAYDFFSAIPFGLTAAESDAWMAREGLALWRELAARFGLVPFEFGATQFQMAGWFRDELGNRRGSLRGRRIRALGLSGEVYRRAGAEVMTTPGSQLVEDFARGALDGVEWFGPSADEALGLPGPSNVMGSAWYYGPSFNRPSQQVALVLSEQALARLDPWRRKIWDIAVADCARWLTTEFRRQDIAALERFRLGLGIKAQRLPENLLNELGDIASALLFERVTDNGDPLTRRIYDSYVGFRSRALSHSKTADESFYSSRLLPFRFDRR